MKWSDPRIKGQTNSATLVKVQISREKKASRPDILQELKKKKTLKVYEESSSIDVREAIVDFPCVVRPTHA